MPREIVVWTTATPAACSAAASSLCVEISRSRMMRRISPWRSRRVTPAPPRGSRAPGRPRRRGGQARLLEGEERPGAANAGLDLVECEERSDLGRGRDRGREEAGVEGIDAALAEPR